VLFSWQCILAVLYFGIEELKMNSGFDGTVKFAKKTPFLDTNRVLNLMLCAVGIGLVAATFILLRQNGELKTLAANALGTSADIQPGKDVSRHLAAVDLAGGFRAISFPAPGAEKTLLITFSPICPHCMANKKNWNVITKELRRRNGWRIFWVSRDPVAMTKSYCEDSAIPLEETFADPTHRTWMGLNLNAVPNTVVVDGRGVVERLWQGELDAAKWDEVFHYFEIPVPEAPSS
jgi:hypothetical protein